MPTAAGALSSARILAWQVSRHEQLIRPGAPAETVSFRRPPACSAFADEGGRIAAALPRARRGGLFVAAMTFDPGWRALARRRAARHLSDRGLPARRCGCRPASTASCSRYRERLARPRRSRHPAGARRRRRRSASSAPARAAPSGVESRNRAAPDPPRHLRRGPRPDRRQLSQRGHLPAAAGDLHGPAALALPGLRRRHPRRRQRARALLPAAARALPRRAAARISWRYPADRGGDGGALPRLLPALRHLASRRRPPPSSPP